MSTADQTAAIAAGLAALSLYVSWVSYRLSERSNDRSLKNEISARETELIALWSGSHLVSQLKPVTPHVERADRTLRVTARRWLDAPEMQAMIYTLFYEDYRTQFEALRDCKVEVPGTGRLGCSYITDDMRDAYSSMSHYHEALKKRESL